MPVRAYLLLEMNLASRTFHSSRQYGRPSGHFQAAALLSNSFAGDLRSHSTSADSKSATNFSDSSYGYNPTFTIFGLCLAAAFMMVGIFAFCMRKCGLASADINSDVQRTERSPPKGLNRENLAQFPIVQYHATAGDIEEGEKGVDCAVCLTQFQQNENVRLLPQCNHLFHPECIDKWLESNTTCPLCRISLAHVEKSPVLSRNIEAEHEVRESSAPAMDESQGVASLGRLTINSGLERDGEREALVILSRSSMSFWKAVQEMETQESAPKNCIQRENVCARRWDSKIRRSRSTESFKLFQEGGCGGALDATEEPPSFLKRAILDKPWKENLITDIATDSAHAADRELSGRVGNTNGNLRCGRFDHGVLKHSFSQTNMYGYSLVEYER